MIRPRRSQVLAGSRLKSIGAEIKSFELPDLDGSGLYSPSAYRAFVEWFGVDRKLATVTGTEFVYESFSCFKAKRVVACHYLKERAETILQILKNYPGFNPGGYWHLPAWIEPHTRKAIVFVLPTAANTPTP